MYRIVKSPGARGVICITFLLAQLLLDEVRQLLYRLEALLPSCRRKGTRLLEQVAVGSYYEAFVHLRQQDVTFDFVIVQGAVENTQYRFDVIFFLDNSIILIIS